VTLTTGPGVDFTNILREAFTQVDPKKRKNILTTSLNFYAFGALCTQKLQVKLG